jgi:hypothetical protein
MMMWWLLACFTESEPSNDVSTIQTTVEFVGEPRLEMENGDLFVLEEAFAVLYSVRFYPCPNTVRYEYIFPISTARAGHSDIEIDTNWNRPTHIDLLDPTSIHTEVQMEPQSICSGAVTWARWDAATFDVPYETVESTYSVLLRGNCRNEDDEQYQFELSTSVPSEKVQSTVVAELNDGVDTLNFTVAFDTTDLLHKIECNDDLMINSSPLALQVLYNIQNNAIWNWEWE